MLEVVHPRCQGLGSPNSTTSELDVPMLLEKVLDTLDIYIFCSGYVYGERALENQARQNGGQVICPKTKEIYSFKDAEKVYIM